MEFGMLLKLVSVMNLMFILSSPIICKEENPTLDYFIQKTKTKNNPSTLDCIWTFTDQFLSNWVWWSTPLKCTVWCQFELLKLSSKVIVIGEMETFVFIFSGISWLIAVKFYVLPWPVGLFKLVLIFDSHDEYLLERTLLCWFLKIIQ